MLNKYNNINNKIGGTNVPNSSINEECEFFKQLNECEHASENPGCPFAVKIGSMEEGISWLKKGVQENKWVGRVGIIIEAVIAILLGFVITVG